MRVFHLTMAVVLGLVLLADASGETIFKDDFEQKFDPVPGRGGNWNENADITGETGTNWRDNSSWAAVGIKYSQEKTNPHSGKACQRIDVSRVSSGAVQFAHTFEGKKGTVVRAHLWARGLGNATLRFGFRQVDTPWKTYAAETVALTPEWREFTVQAEIPNDEKMFLMVWLGSASTFWIDDASIETVDMSKLPPAPKGNLLKNASFEAGIPKNWAYRIEGTPTHKLRDRRPKLAKEGIVGRKSMCIEVLKGSTGTIKAPLVHVTKGQVYTTSIWLKASRNVQITAGLANTKVWSHKFQVNKEWERFTFTGTVRKFVKTCWLQINLPRAEENYSVYIDGVMIEAKDVASQKYSSEYPYEFVLSTDRVGHIFFDGEHTSFSAGVNPAKPEDAKIHVVVHDYNGKPIADTEATLGDNGMLDIAGDGLMRGMFKLKATLTDKDGTQISPVEEISWARIPRPAELKDAKGSYFGIHVPLVGDYVKIARLTGHRWTRLHDASMIAKWKSLEPVEGQYNFYDEAVDLAKQEGLMILGMLDGAPPWIGSKDRGGYWSFWTLPTRADWKAKWRNYCDVAIKHYRGRIDDWEIWNEPWGQWFFSAGGDPAMYVEFMRQAKQSAAANNPDARIIGIDTYGGHDKWTEAALQGGTDTYDIFSYHEYTDAQVGGDDSSNPCMQQGKRWREVQARHGKVKPIWNTEGGIVDLGSFLKPEAGGMHFSLQPAYIVRYDTCNRAAGIGKFFYYAIHLDPAEGENSCRATEVGRAVKPLLAARAVNAYLTDGAAFAKRKEENGIEKYAFKPIRGKQVTTCWSANGHVQQCQVPAGSEALDIWGNPMTVHDGVVAVGSTPIYIVAKAN